MRIFFKFLLFFILFSKLCVAEEVVDLNAPAPASPVQIRLPHSERTKGNILESMIDFLFTRLLKNYEKEDVYVSYSFFELNKEYMLVFSDFLIDVKRKDSKGSVSFKYFKVSFSDFLLFLKEKDFVIGNIILEDVKANLTLFKYNKENKSKYLEEDKKEFILFKPEAERTLIASAKKVHFSNMRLATFDYKTAQKEGPQDTTFSKISATDGFFSLSNPQKTYKTSFAEMDNVVIPQGVLKNTYFSEAKTEGKTFKEMKTFLEEIKK